MDQKRTLAFVFIEYLKIGKGREVSAVRLAFFRFLLGRLCWRFSLFLTLFLFSPNVVVILSALPELGFMTTATTRLNTQQNTYVTHLSIYSGHWIIERSKTRGSQLLLSAAVLYITKLVFQSFILCDVLYRLITMTTVGSARTPSPPSHNFYEVDRRRSEVFCLIRLILPCTSLHIVLSCFKYSLLMFIQDEPKKS